MNYVFRRFFWTCRYCAVARKRGQPTATADTGRLCSTCELFLLLQLVPSTMNNYNVAKKKPPQKNVAGASKEPKKRRSGQRRRGIRTIPCTVFGNINRIRASTAECGRKAAQQDGEIGQASVPEKGCELINRRRRYLFIFVLLDSDVFVRHVNRPVPCMVWIVDIAVAAVAANSAFALNCKANPF